MTVATLAAVAAVVRAVAAVMRTVAGAVAMTTVVVAGFALLAVVAMAVLAERFVMVTMTMSMGAAVALLVAMSAAAVVAAVMEPVGLAVHIHGFVVNRKGGDDFFLFDHGFFHDFGLNHAALHHRAFHVGRFDFHFRSVDDHEATKRVAAVVVTATIPAAFATVVGLAATTGKVAAAAAMTATEVAVAMSKGVSTFGRVAALRGMAAVFMSAEG